MDAVTVVIPTRNRPHMLCTTVRSVLRQRGVDLRVIVVDDGSTGDTEGALEALGDQRVTVVRHPVSKGVSAARNAGLSQATTEWVAFCDDDDLWSPDKLRQQLAAANASRADWAYAGCVHVNAELQVQNATPPMLPDAMREALFRYNAMPAGASNVIARRDVLTGLGGFDASLTHLPDWDLWVRLARHGRPACVSEPLVAYRIHGGNASFRTAEMLAELDGFERRHRLRADRSRFHRHLAHLCLRSGHRAEALRHFTRAVIRWRDGYSVTDMATDVRLVREHVEEVIRRRLHLRPSIRAAERVRAARERDPNAAWKATARGWLEDLRR